MSNDARPLAPIRPATAAQHLTRAGSTTSVALSASSRSALLPRSRTSHACDRCRLLRAKCSGDDRCSKCVKDEMLCQYSDRKREKNRKTLAVKANLIEILRHEKETLLDALKSWKAGMVFDAEQFSSVQRLLDEQSKCSHEDPDTQYTDEPRNQHESHSRIQSVESQSPEASEMSHEEFEAPSTSSILQGRGSSLSAWQTTLKFVVSPDRGTGLSGFVGTMSAMTWLQQASDRIKEQHSTKPLFQSPRADQVSIVDATTLTVFLDDNDILAVDEDAVDLYALPPWDTGLILSEAFFHSLQACFYFVEREEFLAQLRVIYDLRGSAISVSWQQSRYLMLANMIWAVGARWLTNANLGQQDAAHFAHTSTQNDHLLYFARARALGLDHRLQYDRADMDLIQGLGILALYLMINGSIHRAWICIGQTIRHALALGLHRDIAASALPGSARRQRFELWWTLFCIETMLSEITGRPKGVRFPEITVPLRVSYSRLGERADIEPRHRAESLAASGLWKDFLRYQEDLDAGPTPNIPSSGRYELPGDETSALRFTATVELNAIGDRIGTDLYLAPHSSVLDNIRKWVSDVEADFLHWERLHSEDGSSTMALEIQRCSLQIFLYRPFLGDHTIANTSPTTATTAIGATNTTMDTTYARLCVQVTLRLVDLLPDAPSVSLVHQQLPWWSILHYLCQTLAVLLLDLSGNAQQMRQGSTTLLAAMQKILRYLWTLAPASKSAYKTWKVCRSLTMKASGRYGAGGQIYVPEDPPKPSHWSGDDEINLQQTLLNF